MIDEVVKSISSQLQRMGSTVLNSLVGMEAHMVKMNLLLNMGSENQVLFLGIWGMGGIGKPPLPIVSMTDFQVNFQLVISLKTLRRLIRTRVPRTYRKYSSPEFVAVYILIFEAMKQDPGR